MKREHELEIQAAFATPLSNRKRKPAKKSLIMGLKKGGYFIGPRGGKWEDSKHTIPWEQDSGSPKKPKSKDEPTEKVTKKPKSKEEPTKKKVAKEEPTSSAGGSILDDILDDFFHNIAKEPTAEIAEITPSKSQKEITKKKLGENVTISPQRGAEEAISKLFPNATMDDVVHAAGLGLDLPMDIDVRISVDDVAGSVIVEGYMMGADQQASHKPWTREYLGYEVTHDGKENLTFHKDGKEVGTAYLEEGGDVQDIDGDFEDAHELKSQIATDPKFVRRPSLKRRFINGGELIENDFFTMPKSLMGAGLGTKMFHSQVLGAENLGVKKIETYAQGHAKDPSWNGYYTWPLLGYNGDMYNRGKELVSDGFGPPPPETTNELFLMEGGREWWKKNGSSHSATFDIKKGSTSRTILDTYVKAKGLHKSNDAPEVDEELLHKIWDAIMRRKKKSQSDTTKKSLTMGISTPNLIKSVSHDKFISTIMVRDAEVTDINEGRFGAKYADFGSGVKAVLKKQIHSSGDYRGIPQATLHMREAAVYQLDWKLLHFDLVPTTIVAAYDNRMSSIQNWVKGDIASDIIEGVFNRKDPDWKSKVARFSAKVDVDGIRKMIILDLITNQTDRHARNALFDERDKVWAIDNGLAFGKRFKMYYSVFHRFLFRHDLKLKPEEVSRLRSINLAQLKEVLGRYLESEEIEDTYLRIQWVLAQPNLGYDVISKGSEGKDDFPQYSKWFIDHKITGSKNRVISNIEKMGKLIVPTA